MNFSSSSIRRVFKFSTFVAAAALTLTACASEAGGAKESSDSPSITIYSGRSEEIIAPLLEQFTAETGIATVVRYGDSAELAAQILEEGENAKADVFFSQDAGALGALSAAGVLNSLPSSITSLVDAKYRAGDNTWVGISGRGRVFSYNPAKVKVLPTTVLQLAQPEWKGRIGIAPTNASFQAFVTAMRVLKGEDATREFLTGLKTNAVIFEKNSQILDAVESGQVDAGLINHYYWYEKAAEIGADKMTSKIAWFGNNDPGNLVNVAGVGILSDSTDAQTFVSWLLGKSAQDFFTTTTYEYSLLANSAPPAGLPPLAEISSPKINLEDLKTLSVTLEMLSEVGLT